MSLLIFITNQNTKLDEIIENLVPGKCRAILVSTHKMLDHERQYIFDRSDCEWEFFSFSEWFSDEEAFSFDELAISCIQQNISSPELFVSAQYQSLLYKNKSLESKLLLAFGDHSPIFFVADGLGIIRSSWSEQVHSLSPDTISPRHLSKFRNLFSRLRKALYSSKLWTLVSVDEKHFLFIGSVKRLSIVTGASINKYSLPLLLCRFRKIRLFQIRRFINRFINDKGFLQIFGTIHEFDQELVSDLMDLYPQNKICTVVDGFHPSNYPHTYSVKFKNTDIISPSVMSSDWFKQAGLFIRSTPAFLLEPFARKVPNTPKVNVLFALNHAGDWTSLINRSDTDLMVEAAITFALELPHLKVKIRLHPTMDNPEHEGINASLRIKEYISYFGCSNLSLSNTTLHDDLDWSDVVVSEYSQVLIDSFYEGKISLILNLTRRRSFMADFEKIGLSTFSKIENLTQVFRDNNLEQIVNNQNVAADRFNSLQKGYENNASV